MNGPHTHPLYSFLKGLHLGEDKCKDDNDSCAGWASSGECTNNPGYMHKSCRLACKLCKPVYPFAGDVAWNFEYFLLDKGVVVNRWRTGTRLSSGQILETLNAVGKEL